MAKVSVVVPIYNVERYLESCVLSLVRQNLKELEIIMIEDGSIDRSKEIAKELVKKYPERDMKLLENEKNLGLSETRNRGIEIASGDYIGFVDSDDIVSSEMFQKMYDGAVATNFPEIVATQLIPFQVDLEIEDYSYHGNAKLYDLQRNPNYMYYESPSSCTKIFRKDIIEKQKFLKNCIYEDFGFTYAQMIRSRKILSFPNYHYFYRQNNEGIMAMGGDKPNSKIMDVFPIAEELERVAIETESKERLQCQLSTLETILVMQRATDIDNWSNLNYVEKKDLIQDLASLSYEKYRKGNSINSMIVDIMANRNLLDKYQCDLDHPLATSPEKKEREIRDKISVYMKRK